jgi:hypothetical protein
VEGPEAYTTAKAAFDKENIPDLVARVRKYIFIARNLGIKWRVGCPFFASNKKMRNEAKKMRKQTLIRPEEAKLSKTK